MFNRKAQDDLRPEAGEDRREPKPALSPTPAQVPSRDKAVIGRSITIKGEVSGQEDLVVEGSIEGQILLENQHVTIGSSGRVQAEVKATEVTIEGRMVGNIQARERVVITAKGSLIGDIQAARLRVEDGAHLKGTVTLAPKEKEKTIPLNRPGPTAGEEKEEAAG
jgi:cytoskeletal protein CcmA (bactofilin family)